jgi:hypothetical protein
MHKWSMPSHANHHDHHLVTTCPCPLQSTSPCPEDLFFPADDTGQSPKPRGSRHTPERDMVTALGLASACIGMATGASVRRLAPSPHTLLRPLLVPAASPRRQQRSGHAHWPSQALWTTPSSPTVRPRTASTGRRQHAPVLRFQRADARRDRLDVANTAAPSPVTLAHRSHPNTVDLPRPHGLSSLL